MGDGASCPICLATISRESKPEDAVSFGYGGQGSRARLWARVCVYANRPGCINDFKTCTNDDITEIDRFGVVETHEYELQAMLGDIWSPPPEEGE